MGGGGGIGGQLRGAYDQMGAQFQGQEQGPPDFMGDARAAGTSGLARGVSGLLRQMGYEQGRGPFAEEYGNMPGGFFGWGGQSGGPGGGGALTGWQRGLQQSYAHPANYLQMGGQYGQLGPYNTLARDMASGNMGQAAFGPYGMTYQGGMHPSGRVGPWGAPQSMYGGNYPGVGYAGRGGMGRGQGGPYAGWPSSHGPPRYGGPQGGYGNPNASQPGSLYQGPSGQDYFGGFRGNFTPNAAWNPNSRIPGQNPVATPWGGVSNRHPLSSFIRLPSQQQGAGYAGAATTGQSSLPAHLRNPGSPSNPMLSYPGVEQFDPSKMSQPIYQSDAWRRQQSGVQLPFQLPASAGQMGMNRARFLY